MSKSRGTFVTARTYLDSGLDPQLLRYYYAANLGPGVSDLDLSLDEFRNRINADLATTSPTWPRASSRWRSGPGESSPGIRRRESPAWRARPSGWPARPIRPSSIARWCAW